MRDKKSCDLSKFGAFPRVESVIGCFFEDAVNSDTI